MSTNYFDVPLSLERFEKSRGSECGVLLVKCETIDQAIDYSLRWMDVWLEMAGNRFLSMSVEKPVQRKDLVPDPLYTPADGVLRAVLFWERLVLK